MSLEDSDLGQDQAVWGSVPGRDIPAAVCSAGRDAKAFGCTPMHTLPDIPFKWTCRSWNGQAPIPGWGQALNLFGVLSTISTTPPFSLTPLPSTHFEGQTRWREIHFYPMTWFPFSFPGNAIFPYDRNSCYQFLRCMAQLLQSFPLPLHSPLRSPSSCNMMLNSFLCHQCIINIFLLQSLSTWNLKSGSPRKSFSGLPPSQYYSSLGQYFWFHRELSSPPLRFLALLFKCDGKAEA